MDLATVLQIGRQARDLTEEFANEDEARSDEMIGDPGNLGGFCAIGSYIFYKLALRQSIPVTFVVGRYIGDDYECGGCAHCWIEWDQYIIDITATQFDVLEEIHVASVQSQTYQAAYRGIKALNFVNKKWDYQSPDFYHPELESKIDKITPAIQYLSA